MLSNELKDLFRIQMADTVQPYLWDEPEAYAYIDDAQKMFCRLTDGISDATTTAVCEIPVAVGDDWIDLHPSIKKIRGVTRASDGKPVAVVNYEDLASRGIRFDGTQGAIECIVVGMEEDKARCTRIVSAADTLNLLVFRLPIDDITKDKQELEIASKHHLHILSWAKSLAYLKQDAQTLNKTKSAEFEAIFRAYCKKVEIEQQEKRHKVRTVAYGGIEMNSGSGFSRGGNW